MAKNKGIAILLVLAMIISLMVVTVQADEITVSEKIEIKGTNEVAIGDYNAVVVKQSNGSLVWIKDGNDAANNEIVSAVVGADPSVKEYHVVSGDGTFSFGDYYEGNQYKKTSLTIAENVLYIDGDYSHASTFAYSTNTPDPEPEETEPKETE